MGIFDAVAALFQGERKAEERRRREEALRAVFKARCRHFKALLSANKRALETMTGLEEALKGERHFGMSFVRGSCTTIIANVFNMVRHLNGLSDDAYAALFDRLKEIQRRVGEAVAPAVAGEGGPLVLPLKETGFALAHEVGGKMASLGEAWQRLGQHIPDGFVITASGFRRFMEANNLRDEIHRRAQMADLSSLEAVFGLSSSLQQLIIAAPVPEDLKTAIMAQYEVLRAADPDVRLAVRSSAIGEDALGASFAGQYRSELNVSGDLLLDAFREVIASKYGVTAMTYRINRGIPDDDVAMCVGCLVMVDAEAGGVAYSIDPLHNRDEVVINAVPGLPKAVVDGSGEADVFRISRAVPHAVVSVNVPLKRSRLVCAPGEGVGRKELAPEEGGRASLTDEQALEVARVTMGFEVFYGRPQDVEWAYTRDGRLIILQSRALSGMEDEVEQGPPPRGAEILLDGGVCASPGVGSGDAFLVRRDADLLRFPAGAVLVVEQAHARWAPVLSRAAAVVSELGGAAGHLASVAREYGVPALFGVPEAVRLLAPGRRITVDADAHRVFAGEVNEILSRKRKARPSFAGSPVYAVLERAVRHIVPLNLLDPQAPEFAPGHCETLHDITRFCHEKAVEEMFRLDTTLFSDRFGKQLKYKGGKLQYFVVNIENGFCGQVDGKYVEMEQICCAPMHALWEGMLAIPWLGPVGGTGRGFLAVVAESASNPELEITNASTRMMRNYFLVDKDFCNLQASFGYHFCTVEAQTGEEEQENYVSFHFKGGAANLARRKLRVNAIADVLAENGFIVDMKEDALSARAEELSADDACDLLRILGYLLVHTRQRDASLSGDESRNAFADSLRSGIAEVLHLCGSSRQQVEDSREKA